jgi:hypothetical protein
LGNIATIVCQTIPIQQIKRIVAGFGDCSDIILCTYRGLGANGWSAKQAQKGDYQIAFGKNHFGGLYMSGGKSTADLQINRLVPYCCWFNSMSEFKDFKNPVLIFSTFAGPKKPPITRDSPCKLYHPLTCSTAN